MKKLALALTLIASLNIFAEAELSLPKGPGYAGDLRFTETVVSVEDYQAVTYVDLLGYNENFERINSYVTEKAQASIICKKPTGQFLFVKTYDEKNSCGLVILRNVKTEDNFYPNLIIGPLSDNPTKTKILAQAIFAKMNGGEQTIKTSQVNFPLSSKEIGGLEYLSAQPSSFITAGISVKKWEHLVTTDKDTLFSTEAKKENMKGGLVYKVYNKKNSSKTKKYTLELELNLKASKVENSVQVLNFEAGLK